MAQWVKNLPAMQETWIWPLCQENLLEEGTATHSQYSYLENPMDRGPWWATIHEVTESWTQLSMGMKGFTFLEI